VFGSGDYSSLEEYWQKYGIDGGQMTAEENIESTMPDVTPTVPAQLHGYRRNRAISGATAVVSMGQSFPSHHPALSLPGVIEEFGPLIFPLYRAALLRKRVLLVGKPPVEQHCNFGMIELLLRNFSSRRELIYCSIWLVDSLLSSKFSVVSSASRRHPTAPSTAAL
jgi:hypothetical protein